MFKKILTRLKDLYLSPVNLFFRAIKRPLNPRWLVFEITNLCNSRCTHCNIWNTPSTTKALTPQEIEKILSDKIFRKLERILITGGEAFVRHDLEEIVLLMHKILPKAKIWLSTNGLLPERAIKIVKTALKNNIFIGIGISLDGIGKEHDTIRGVPGNFEKADRLIQEMVLLKNKNRNKIEVAIGFTLSNLTAHSTKQVIDYAKKFNTDITIAIYEQGSFYHNIGNEIIKNEKLIKAAQLLPDSHHNNILRNVISGKRFKFSCFAMQRFCLLRSNGSIAPCLRLAHLSAGNIREASPSEIWQSKKMKEIRQTVKDCEGCLNTWAIGWSFQSYKVLPIIYYSLKTRIKKLIT